MNYLSCKPNQPPIKIFLRSVNQHPFEHAVKPGEGQQAGVDQELDNLHLQVLQTVALRKIR